MPKTSRPFSLKKHPEYGTYYYSLLPGSGLPEELLEKRRTTGHERRDRAEQYVLERIRVLQEIARLKRDRPGAIRLAEYAGPFYTDDCPHLARIGKEISPGTVRTYRYIVEAFIIGGPLGDRLLDEITPEDIVRFRTWLMDGRTRSTVKGYMERLRTILNEAVIQGKLPASPARAVPRLETSQHRGRFNRDELKTLFVERPGFWPTDAAWVGGLVAAMTGMRQSEISALEWRHFHGDWIRIEQAWKERGVLGPTKTGETREIPIAPSLQRVLEDWGARHDRSGLVFRSPRGDGGRMYRYGENWPGAQAAKAIAKSQITKKDESGSRSLHSLRHTLASILVEEGVFPILVQRYFGWSNLGRNSAVTPVQGGYTHISREALVPVAEAIEAIFSPFVG